MAALRAAKSSNIFFAVRLWFDSFTELQLNAVPSSAAAFYGNTRMLPKKTVQQSALDLVIEIKLNTEETNGMLLGRKYKLWLGI